jgi:hypothetical protein
MAYFEEDARKAIGIAGRILEHIGKLIGKEAES